MPGARELKRRIGSAASISQITRAMESVAAGKMRRAQAAAKSGRGYQLMLKKITENIRKFIDKEAHALLVPPADPAALAEAIVTLLRDRDLARRLGEAAQAASRQYSIEAHVDSLRHLYREVVS
mgnify:CR=1 FL=1